VTISFVFCQLVRIAIVIVHSGGVPADARLVDDGSPVRSAIITASSAGIPRIPDLALDPTTPSLTS